MTRSGDETKSSRQQSSGMSSDGDARPSVLAAYVAVARPDHWFKNVFMLLGAALAYFCHFGEGTPVRVGTLGWAFAATCLVASSNYVLNEILDAPTDRAHPIKRNRPIPSGRVRLPVAYGQWIVLAVAGLGMAWAVNLPFAAAAGLLWVMGIVYNVRPLRTKELPYLDTLSESVNNPIRLALGWFAVTAAAVPPLSLLISYWMAGGFFMAAKRFAEYRQIRDPARAAAYRSSFGHYDENKLLLSMFFYATAAALFLGVFIIRYHLELLLSVPLIAGFFSYYFWISLKDESAAQAPERLYRERGLMLYLVVCLAVFVGLLFVRISILYTWFNVPPSTVQTLWEL
ncbi:MAG: UbiA prenyltransferase family protein [Pirellulales bacterium]|nr:UbiA prenyltransferase family protein [Pirellulales bacterium]